MEEFKTVVIVESRIYEKIQLYRSFLEKSEFKTKLSQTRFISEDSAEDLSSAELNNVVNCLYLYDMLNVDDYKARRDMLCKKAGDYPNSNFYMIFCQNLLNDKPYDKPEVVEGLINKPFCIGIPEGANLADDEESAENLRCVKLLSLAIAICSYNDGPGGCYTPEFYYVTASIDVNYTKVFYAASYELSEFAEIIKDKLQQIDELESVIDRIKKEKPHKCTGNYGVDSQSFDSLKLRDFSEYSDVESLRREMEFWGNKCVSQYDESVAAKINTARYGLAFAEDNIKANYSRETDGSVAVDVDYDVNNQYMTVTESEEGQVASPDELLDRPDNNMGFDVAMIRSALPLAKELESTQAPSLRRVFPVCLCALLLFVVSAASVYIVRYFMSGLSGVDMSDVLVTILIPVAAILLIAVVAFGIFLFQKKQKKKVFKDLHTRLSSFVEKLKTAGSNIDNYIDKYLTVYFNYHIKYNLIKKFGEDIKELKKDIELIRAKSVPYDGMATIMCRLSGDIIPDPKKEISENGKVIKTVSQVIIQYITENISTKNNDNNAPQELLSPWMTSVDVEIGSYSSEE